MRDSDIILDYFNLLHYKCHKINLKRLGSYIDSSNWIKNKKATMNHINDNGRCFQYALTVALKHEETGRNKKNKQK